MEKAAILDVDSALTSSMLIAPRRTVAALLRKWSTGRSQCVLLPVGIEPDGGSNQHSCQT
jgi:hypothetical protein